MIAVRNNSKTGAIGWRVMRWFAMLLVVLAFGVAGISMAESHPVQHLAEQGPAGEVFDSALDSQECCDETDPGHTNGSCTSFGHCVGCAIGNAGIPGPEFFSEACLELRLIILPAGFASGPAAHPPKVS